MWKWDTVELAIFHSVADLRLFLFAISVTTRGDRHELQTRALSLNIYLEFIH